MERITVAGASNYFTVSACFIIPPSGRPEATRIFLKHLGFFYYLLFRQRKASAFACCSGLSSRRCLSAAPLAKCRLKPLTDVTLLFHTDCSPRRRSRRSLDCESASQGEGREIEIQQLVPSNEDKHTRTQLEEYHPEPGSGLQANCWINWKIYAVSLWYNAR